MAAAGEHAVTTVLELEELIELVFGFLTAFQLAQICS